MGPKPPGTGADGRVCAAIQLAYTLIGCQNKDHDIYDSNSCQAVGTKSSLGVKIDMPTPTALPVVFKKGK